MSPPAPPDSDAPVATVRVEAPALPLARRAVLLVAALLHARSLDLPDAPLDTLLSALSGPLSHEPTRAWLLLVNGLSLVLRASVAAFAVGVVVAALRGRALRRSAPAGPAAVRADARGLHVDGALVVPAADVERAEVAVDPGGGFALVVRTREGAIWRAALEGEDEARFLAVALDPKGHPGELLFEGVAGRRTRETAVAAGALGVALVAALLRGSLEEVGFWSWISGRAGELAFSHHPEIAAFWIAFGVAGLGMLLVIALAGGAVAPVLRRMRPGRARVGPRGLTVGEGSAARHVPVEDIEAVDAQGHDGVRIAVRGEAPVALRFSADRPVAERALLVARTRAAARLDEASAATSGPRVAVSQEGEPPVDDEEAEEVRAAGKRRRA